MSRPPGAIPFAIQPSNRMGLSAARACKGRATSVVFATPLVSVYAQLQAQGCMGADRHGGAPEPLHSKQGAQTGRLTRRSRAGWSKGHRGSEDRNILCHQPPNSGLSFVQPGLIHSEGPWVAAK